ncbi:MAG: SDR family NAD(P)-dependent oxidoreductase [Tannerella sp.]|jgi:NADP-dependent 3-hydroxy acid dehydrogenase YdfG|nr:SDR family NAD(P)-dependent oxidoreductase [Tannerella sp.]
MNSTVLITGATSGIGKATAERLAIEGCRLIITGRREGLLLELKGKLEDKYKAEVLALCFDLRDREAVEKNLGKLPKEWAEVDVLVNNAGLAVGLAPIQEGIIDDWERMIDTNIKGLLYVTRCIVPGMAARRHGHIVNLGSIAGREVYPGGNVYCATKHAVNALSQGMRMDLLPYGVKVTQICPGAVETEFSLVRFKGNKERAAQVYEGFEPLCAADVADAIYFALSAPEHVDVQDLLLMAKAQASSGLFHKE